jgi:hypothetical protein
MRKILLALSIINFIWISNSFGQAIIFSEDFESGELPLDWKQEFIKGAINWRYEDGGYSLNPSIPYSRKPISAHGGEYNALFQFQSSNNEATKLVTKKIEALEFAIKPELHFFNAQYDWLHGSDYYHDYLRVYYKSSSTSSWKLLQEFTSATTNWVERIIVLPENDLSADYYLAFEGETKWGWGTCVDDIQIVETGILQKYLDDISIEQASDVSVASGASNNPILKIKLKVMGNTGSFPLNSLVLNSQNTSDADIASGGVKLFLTQDAEFNSVNQIGTGVSFTSGQAVFSNLNYNLPTGYSYLWITYDVKLTAGHRNLLDAKITANSININGNTYFNEEKSPEGSRMILQTLHSDDFESALNWDLSGEFEYGSPQGLGGTQGNPDPDAAFSGTNIIGTDLTGLGDYAGDYEKNLTLDAYSAISDTFDFTYYNDLSIRYMRYLNIGVNDEAFVDISTDGGITWKEAWSNSSMILDNSWKLHEINITEQAARESKVLVRFSLGTTNDYWQLSGWNIDNFTITGNYVSKDVGISRIVSPVKGCGHTDDDTVTVIIKNFGASDSYGIIPLQYSFDGNETIFQDTLYQMIPFGDSIQYTFKKKVDLSVADIYNFIVTTSMNEDDDPSNDGIEELFYAQPTIDYNYTETFESKGGLWMLSTGSTSSWEWGSPGFGIDPPSGDKLWMTKLLANYPDNDSSLIESVCYQNENDERKILQLKYWIESESNKDGACLQYSTDNGSTWNLLYTLITGWNWYNDSIDALNSRGWSGNSQGWVTAQLILPAHITNEPIMKFRTVFASNQEINNLGFAFDDFSIASAPPDIGVYQIDSFADRCQYINPDRLTVTIKNFGINPLKENDTIIVGFNFDQNPVAIDTFKLTAELLPGQTFKHTFNEKVDVTMPGSYSITAYTLIEDNPYFYLSNNDTASVEFEVLANPLTQLIDTIQTRIPDTVVIVPFYDPDYDYLWHDSTTSSTYNVQHDGWHYVTVTDARGNGCSSNDSTYVELLFNDVGVDSLIYPYNHCGLSNQEYLSVRIKNFGTDSIPANEKITVAYEFDFGPPVIDTLVLQKTLKAKHTVIFDFSTGAVDLSNKGIYNFKIFADYGGDTLHLNDTISRNIEIFGHPEVDIGPDRTIQALTYTLDAGSGYISYLWDNGATTQTREVFQSDTCWVQVFDENNCDNFDTAYIRLKIRDIRAEGFISPVSDCSFDPAEPVSLKIINSGTDTVPSGEQIAVSYTLNEGSAVNESFDLSEQLLPGSCLIHTFTGTVNMSDTADYNFKVTTVMDNDMRIFNDTLEFLIYRYPKPVVDFGLDEIEYVEGIEFPVEAGYSPYLNYQWQDSYTGHLYNVVKSGTYRVMATDSRTGCADGDTVSVFLIYSDVGVTSSGMPAEGCTGEIDNLLVSVTNLGSSNIGKDVPIYVACEVNGIRVTVDTLVRTGIFATNTSLSLTLSEPLTIEDEGSSKIAIYTLFGQDMKLWNDTLIIWYNAQPSPVIDFEDNNGVLQTDLPHILDAGAGHKSYLWQDGSTNQTFTVTQSGEYSVIVTGQNNCQSSYTVTINPVTGMNDLRENLKNIILYPNPNNGLFYISFGSFDWGKNEDLIIKILNTQGQVVFMQKYETSGLVHESINLQHLTRGLYHLLIYNSKIIYQTKVVIQ